MTDEQFESLFSGMQRHLEKMMDEKLSAMEARFDTKLQQLETHFDAKLARLRTQTSTLRTVDLEIESRVQNLEDRTN